MFGIGNQAALSSMLQGQYQNNQLYGQWGANALNSVSGLYGANLPMNLDFPFGQGMGFMPLQSTPVQAPPIMPQFMGMGGMGMTGGMGMFGGMGMTGSMGMGMTGGMFGAGFANTYRPYVARQGMSNIGYNFMGRTSGVMNNATQPNLGIGQRGTGYGNTEYKTYTRKSYNPFTGGRVTSEKHYKTPVYEYEKQKAVDYHFQLGQKFHNKDVQVSRQTRSYDPVILDLNSDGKLDVTGKDNSSVNKNVKTSSKSSVSTSGRRRTTTTTRTKEWDTYKDWNKKINYDVDGDGTVDRTEWLKKGAEDGFLVMDVDGDGSITGKELMNESDINGKKNVFKGGFEKAAFYGDANKDGKIAGDELKKFSVWVDGNGDGVTDKGELKNLADLGIMEIDTVEGSFTRRKEVGVNEKHFTFDSYQVV